MQATRYTITVPLTRNDGSLIGQHEYEGFERILRRASDGWTILNGDGCWYDQETHRRYDEAVLVYVVDTGEPATQLILAAAEYVKQQFDQAAVYVTWQAIGTLLV